MNGRKITKVTLLHYIKLTYRSILFICGLVWYILVKTGNKKVSLNEIPSGAVAVVPAIIWLVFMVEMILRFFPSHLESPGCQKQFRDNYISTGKTDIIIQDDNATVIVAFIWIILNAGIGALYMTNIIDQGIMLLLSLAYSICDIICILFFCPFQSWFLKNKCCSTCRIYNWDYAMMFSPLFFVPGKYTWSLLLASVILLVRWEITVWKYPERFSENTNAYLKCTNCTEKLCVHKKQLRRLWDRLNIEKKLKEKRILQGIEKHKK